MKKQINTLKNKPLTVEGLISRRAFVKSERGLVEQALELAATVPLYEGGKNHMFVGGIALRYYIDEKFKGKMGTGRLSSTDVDVVFEKIPDAIKKLCKKEPVVKPSFKISTTGIKKIKNNGHGVVYHIQGIFRDKFPLYKDVCFFENEVGRIKLNEKDYKKAIVEMVELPLKQKENNTYIVEFKIMDLGLLIATILTPQAITEIRGRRIGFAIASNMDEIENIVKRYAKIVERNNMREEEIIEPLKKMYQASMKYVQKDIKAFLEELSKILDPAKHVLKNVLKNN